MLLGLVMVSGLFAAQVSVSINPLKLGKETKMHRLVYIAEALAAGASLGADGYSTEVAVVQTPRNLLRRQGYCNPCIVEANPLFEASSNGVKSFSQLKFWTYKSLLAAAPFAGTFAIHKLHKESMATDVASIISSGSEAAFYTTVAFKNFHLADKVTHEQKPPVP